MKQLLLITTLTLLSFQSFSQDQSSRIMTNTPFQNNIEPTNIERYKVDYELKDYNFINGDSTILMQLNLKEIESFRNISGNENIEIKDPNTGLIIILYPNKNINLSPISKH